MEPRQNAKLRMRIFATLIDYIVFGCLFFFFITKYGEPNTHGGHTVTGLKAFIPLLFWLIYFVLIESSISATAGHFILGLKVTKVDNNRIRIVDSLKRHFLDPIDFFFFGIPAIITIRNTPLNQRIGDLFAKTIVVNDKEENEE